MSTPGWGSLFDVTPLRNLGRHVAAGGVGGVRPSSGRRAPCAITNSKAGEPLARSRSWCPRTTWAWRVVGCSPPARSGQSRRAAPAWRPSASSTYRLAELLAAPVLAAAGRRPVSTPVLAAAMRAELAAEPGLFGPVAEHPATESALVRAYRELRDLSPAARRRGSHVKPGERGRAPAPRRARSPRTSLVRRAGPARGRGQRAGHARPGRSAR